MKRLDRLNLLLLGFIIAVLISCTQGVKQQNTVKAVKKNIVKNCCNANFPSRFGQLAKAKLDTVSTKK